MNVEKNTAYVVTCPRCDTRNAYRTSDAGKEVRCEMCHVRFTAPQLPQRKTPEAQRTPQRRSGYGVAKKGSTEQPRLFSVDCELCGTRMTFREEHEGRRARCPDCYTELTIPKPPPRAKKNETTIGSYGVAAEEAQPPTELKGDLGYAFIPRPGTGGPLFSDDEVEGYAEQEPQPPSVGNPPRARPQKTPPAQSGAEPGLEAWAASRSSTGGESPPTSGRWKHEVSPDAYPRAHKPKVQKPREEKLGRVEKNSRRVAERRARGEGYDDLRHNPIPDAPALPMLSGIYTTPFHPEAIYRLVTLTVLLAVDAAAIAYMFFVMSIIGLYGYIIAFGAMLITAIAGGFAVICVRGIVLDTANGAKEITGWPDLDWREWVFAFGQFMAPILLAMGIAHFPAAFLENAGLSYRIVGFTVGALFFPVFYLASIYEGHWLQMFSVFILKSFVRIPHVWIAYYLHVALMLAAGVIVFRLGYEIYPITTLFVMCPLLAAGSFIWARLSGRLLWVAGQAEVAARDE
ncbi:MAG: hypothetical protein MPJ50_05245 [Pirellulales bacterium]|nr:hypothetical protein [Pirellulales bacterium]